MTKIFLYSHSTKTLTEKAGMEKPVFSKGYDAFDRALNYKIALQDYEAHLASLKTYPTSGFSESDNGNEFELEKDFDLYEEFYGEAGGFKVVARRRPQPEGQVLNCNQCAGTLFWIRGKYPGTEKRLVCPTCNTERLEQIHEISDKNYGIAYISKNDTNF